MRKHYPLLFLFIILSYCPLLAQNNFALKSDAKRFWISMDITEMQVSISGLQLNEGYELSLNSMDDVSLLVMDSLAKSIPFTAIAQKRTFTLRKKSTSKIQFWLSISKTTSASFNQNQGAEDNLIVDDNLSADELVKGILIGNNCSVDMKIQQHGESVQFGTFSKGLESIGFESGIIISTGNIYNSPGPNNTGSKGNNVPGNNTDPDLSSLANESIFDAAVIEFDFTPVTDKVQFEYVFASEEYCEFVNDDYNDIFGFFISGPGINGVQNIARIPGSGQAVSIDNINHLKNSSLFTPNSSTCGGKTNMEDIQFDGYTHPLVASATVIPCETYHIKLAIADVGDAIYDSAVFLKAGSFNAGDIVNVTPKSNIIQVQNTLEGCDNGSLLFDRSCSNDLNQPLTLTLNILPSSTAQKGIDYLALPKTFTIPAGEATASLPISALNDNITEGEEHIDIEITGQYPCYKPTVSITISDPISFSATGVDSTLCQNTNASFSPTIQGGIAPFSYQWASGEKTNTLTKDFDSSQKIQCVIADACNSEVEVAFDITAIPPAKGIISGDGVLCNSSSNSTIALEFSGPSPWDVVIEKNGAEFFTKQYSSPSSSFSVNESGQYRIQSISSYGCIGSQKGEANITNTGLQASFSKTDVSCFGLNDGQITAEPFGGRLPLQFNWSTGTESNLAENLTLGDYAFTITDADGCTIAQDIQISEPEKLSFKVSELTHTNCYFPQGGSITTTSTGGTKPYYYKWNFGNESANLNNLPPNSYHGTIEDSQGCKDSIEITIQGDFKKPEFSILPPSIINCYQGEIDLTTEGITENIFTYHWQTASGHITSNISKNNIAVDKAGIYSLTVQDTINGCLSLDTVIVLADKTAPSIDLGLPKELNCTDTMVTIGTPDTIPNFNYLWSTTTGNTMLSSTLPQTTVSEAGTYQLQITNIINGCQAIKEINVTAITTYPESAEITISPPTCLGNDGQIKISEVRGGTPPLVYSFNGGQTFLTESALSHVKPGAYNIVIQDLYGCEYQDITNLYEPYPPSLNVTPRFTIKLGDELQLEAWSNQLATELDTIIWSPLADSACLSCFNPTVKPLQTTTYLLKIIDSLHCEASEEITVVVQDPTVYIPNVFSPRSNFGNDRFTILGDPKRIEKINQFIIFDRWGSQVFSNFDFMIGDAYAGWDGRYRNKNSPQGVYIYFAEIELINGKRIQQKGNVTLIR